MIVYISKYRYSLEEGETGSKKGGGQRSSNGDSGYGPVVHNFLGVMIEYYRNFKILLSTYQLNIRPFEPIKYA
jgi:hypothetical protein